MPMTWYPSARSRRARLLPMKPATPVIRTCSGDGDRLRKLVTRLLRVVEEHLDRFAGEFVEIFVFKLELGPQVGSHRDDVATALLCLINVQDFPWTRPQHAHLGP